MFTEIISHYSEPLLGYQFGKDPGGTAPGKKLGLVRPYLIS
jgi:hypothetical protein